MTAFSDDDVIRYVLGEATPEAGSALRAGAANDRELAATVELLSQFGSTTFGETVSDQRATRRSPIWARRIALALIACLTIGGLSWAAITVLTPKPLLEDHFESNWGDTNKWKTPRRSVFVENGHVRLFDRGYLVTFEEYPGPIDLTFRWRWTDLAGDFHYRDELTVALRTSGTPREVQAFEATDGVFVKLNATAGIITIMAADDLFKRLAGTEDSSFPFPAEQWHKVRITDDGETVSVYLTDATRPAVFHEKPIASVRIPQTTNKHHIAFYNRERLAEASHESWIDDVVLRPLEAAEH